MEENPRGNGWQSYRRKGEDRSRHRGGAEGSKSFSVEAKTFILDLRRQKGSLRGIIKERRRNLSSWVLLGPASLRFFLEGIERSFCELREERWAWNWKEEGRRYEMAKNTNRAGPFVSLKVFYPREKKFSLFVSRGRKKEGWCEMAEILREMAVKMRLDLQKGKAAKSREEERKPWKVGV